MVKNSANSSKPTLKGVDPSGGLDRLEPMVKDTVPEEKRVLTVELPVAAIEKLKARAKRNERSLAGELRFILTMAAEEDHA